MARGPPVNVQYEQRKGAGQSYRSAGTGWAHQERRSCWPMALSTSCRTVTPFALRRSMCGAGSACDSMRLQQPHVMRGLLDRVSCLQLRGSWCALSILRRFVQKQLDAAREAPAAGSPGAACDHASLPDVPANRQRNLPHQCLLLACWRTNMFASVPVAV